MAKIGRNEPCPCGSGNKYKKCCLGTDQQQLRASDQQQLRASSEAVPQADALSQLAQHSSFEAEASRHERMTPYVLAKRFEQSEKIAEWQRREPRMAASCWTPSKVAVLATKDITARLRRLGIETSRERYLALASKHTSAWKLSKLWRNKLRRKLSWSESDFVGLAACELWKRYCPERPSVEMLEDWMQQGYQFMMAVHGPHACDLWWHVWQTIRQRLGPEMRTCEAARGVFDGTQVLHDWVQDLALELQNAAVGEPRYAHQGVELCERVLEQFVDEDELFRINFRADLGRFYFLADQPEDGERVLLELIHDEPDTSAGYARLADILAYGVRRSDRPIDRQRAIRIVEEALARPVSDAAEYDMKARLEELRESIALAATNEESPASS